MDSTVVDLLNEIGMLAATPRSGFAFLGSGAQSVAEHSYRTAVVGMALADAVEEEVDRERLLYLCLFHDLLEARTGDINYVNKRYVRKDDSKALADFKRHATPLAATVAKHIEEFEKGESVESRLAHDADQVELLLVLKQLYDTGNPRAEAWFERVEKRLQTDAAKEMAATIWETPSDNWWFADKDDPHWVEGQNPQ